jgi:hypothetical protein
MRKFFLRRSMQRRPPVLGIEQAKGTLTFVAGFGESIVGVPGLKAAAQTVVEIIRVAQVCCAVVRLRLRQIGANLTCYL